MSEILNSRKGEHNLLVYPDTGSFRAIYAPLCKQLIDSNDIVVFLTYYDPVDSVFKLLSDSGIDVDKHRRNGNLIIADAVEQFLGKGKDFLMFLLRLERQVKELAKNQVSVITSMGAFLLYEKIEEMLEYEGLLDLSEVRNWKVLCCYHQGDYNALPELTKQELLARHNRRLFTVD